MSSASWKPLQETGEKRAKRHFFPLCLGIFLIKLIVIFIVVAFYRTHSNHNVFNSADLNEECISESLTYVEPLNKSMGSYILKINYTKTAKYSNNIYCCYSKLVFEKKNPEKNNETTAKFSEDCEMFRDPVHLQNEKLILVRCDQKSINLESRFSHYVNIHTMPKTKISSKDMSEMSYYRKDNLIERSSPEDDEKLNFLIIGFDAESTTNIIKHMPRTRELMKEIGFIEFEKYTTLIDNKTYDDIAIVTGLTYTEQVLSCPFTCAKYEDVLGNHNYIGDYEEYNMRFNSEYSNMFYKCQRPQLPLKTMLEDILDEAESYKNYFRISVKWLHKMMEKDIESAEILDSETFNFFNRVRYNNLSNNTVIFFMSYNRINYGNYFHLPSSLKATLHIFLPQWFKTKYSLHSLDFKNFVENRKKTVYPYDIYCTVADIIHKSNINENSRHDYSARHCKSLFEKINRD